MFVGRDIRFLGFLFFVALFCHQNRGVCSYVEELDDGDVTCVGRRVPGTGNEERVGEHETSRQKGVDTRLEDDGQVAVSVGNPVGWLAGGDKRVLLARVGEEALRFLPFQILWQPSMFGVGGAVSRWTVWDLPPLFPYFLLGEDQFFSRPGSRVALDRFLGGVIVSDPRLLNVRRVRQNGRVEIWKEYENHSTRTYFVWQPPIERNGFMMLQGYVAIEVVPRMIAFTASVS